MLILSNDVLGVVNVTGRRGAPERTRATLAARFSLTAHDRLLDEKGEIVIFFKRNCRRVKVSSWLSSRFEVVVGHTGEVAR